MEKTIFYHAGCPVCRSAEEEVIDLIGKENLIVVHLGEQREQIGKAETFGVKSVPALVTGKGNVLHINYGASIEEIKN
ncbi:conjugal transfer protein TraF [Flagellimonas meishanensis]|uniref:conjugal transfer protein TraF n=1 Tax=Flagellimonas meishanensis TaxID=2873264 RepID=UPI001CA6BE9B|nr:conjugal transfer protein TraF [[Muricauda] meishanensis]